MTIEGFHLSPQQKRLWSLGSAGDRIECRCRVKVEGSVEPGALVRALERVIDRHEILRTRLESVPGLVFPLQVVEPEGRISIQGTDGVESGGTRGAQASAGEDLGLQSSGPGRLQAFLRRRSASGLDLELRGSGLLLDARGMEVLVADLARAYAALPDGRGWVEPAPQYADVAEWLNQVLADGEGSEGHDFWRRRWAAIDLRLDLPFRSPSPERGPRELRQVVRRLDPELVHRLRSAAAGEGVPCSRVLLAAWCVLLWRFGGRSPLAVATAFDGRTHPELQETPGPLVRYLPITADPGSRRSFRELLRRLAEDAEEAGAWQETFSWEARQEGPGPEAAAAPAGFEWLDRGRPLEAGGATFAIEDLEVWLDRFELKLTGMASPDSLRLTLTYDAGLFEPTHVESLADGLEVLLRAAVEDPDVRPARLPILGDAELRRLTLALGARKRAVPLVPAPRLVSECARRLPGARAVAWEGGSLTYAELEARSDRMARFLTGRGVGPDVVVAVYGDRTAEMVVAVLGILKAGGAYLPLDPAYPEPRLRFALDESHARILVSNRPRAECLLQAGIEVVSLVDDRERIDAQPAEEPAGEIPLDSLAYVIYTSGSTGAPKGTAVSHRGLVNYLAWCSEAYPLAGGDGVPVHSPLGFDLTVTSLLAPLTAGGCVRLIPEADGLEGLATLLRRPTRLDLVKLTPSHLRLLRHQLAAEDVRAEVRAVILGGEQLRGDDLEWWQRLWPKALFVNEYGPTEAVVGCCTHQVAGAAVERGPVPIGRAIPNVKILLLDEGRHPVPAGVPGEIFIGGAAPARGYTRRPRATADRFLPLSWGAPGERFYRTGDLARYRGDGHLEFLGRCDRQVKIRGHRVEPGEIEAVLEEHPGVARAAVTFRVPAPGEEHLLAYVVPDDGTAAVVRRLMELERNGHGARHALVDLPNGMSIAHRNRAETDYLYREIFEDRCYLAPGIRLEEGDCVFDVGANIGVFSLFVATRCPGVSVFAFEPIPATFETLELNLELYGVRAEAFNCGLADRGGWEEFVHYPHLTLMSGRFPGTDDVETVKTYERGRPAGGSGWDEGALDEAVALRLESEVLTCRLRTLSDVIREHALERIDLLKIDAEKSELDVLAGLEDGDWPKVRQVVVEVHDVEGRLESVRGMLERRGFRVGVGRERALEGSQLYLVSGVRPEIPAAAPPGPAPQRWNSRGRLVDDLRRHLLDRLPEPMVPSTVLLLERLPLTANGKLDEAALPVPETEGGRGGGAGAAAPRRTVEEVLASLWARLLPPGEVRTDTSFFEAGGHSLLAARLLSEVRETFEVEVSLGEFFREPTLGALARCVEDAVTGAAEGGAPTLERLARRDAFPLSFAQQRLWFLDELDPGRPDYNVRAALRVTGGFGLAAFEASLGEVVRRHEVLRTRFPSSSGGPVQQVTTYRPTALPLVDLTALSGRDRTREARSLVGREGTRGFHLAAGPVWRGRLVRLDGAEHHVTVTVHHIVTDAQSMDLMLDEVLRLYEAFSRGRPSPLPELPMQYGDYAHWQRRWLSGDRLEREVDYWRRRLYGVRRLELATDRERPAAPTYRGAREAFIWHGELSRGLRDLARREGATLFMVMLAVLKVHLHFLGDQDEIVVGTNVAERSRPETEGMIGLFLNQIVLRTDLSGDPSFREVVGRILRVNLEAYAHQGLPFEKVVQILEEERDLGQTPLFQVKLEMRHRDGDGRGSRVAGVTLESLEDQHPVSHFDLHLAVEAGGDELVGSLTYNRDLFHASTARRFLAGLQTVAALAVDRPETKLGALAGELRRRERSERSDTERELQRLSVERLRNMTRTV